MKWGYVRYHFPHHYINYCIFYNAKVEKKAKPDCSNTTLMIWGEIYPGVRMVWTRRTTLFLRSHLCPQWFWPMLLHHITTSWHQSCRTCWMLEDPRACAITGGYRCPVTLVSIQRHVIFAFKLRFSGIVQSEGVMDIGYWQVLALIFIFSIFHMITIQILSWISSQIITLKLLHFTDDRTYFEFEPWFELCLIQ